MPRPPGIENPRSSFSRWAGSNGRFETDLVFLLDFETRMRQREREFAVVGHEQKALAFEVEPADMEDAWPVLRQQVEDGFASAFVLRRADDTGRFVKERGQRRLRLQHAASDFHGILRTDFRRQFRDDAPIDLHPTGTDEFFDAAARAESGGGKKTIQAHGDAQFRSRGEMRNFSFCNPAGLAYLTAPIALHVHTEASHPPKDRLSLVALLPFAAAVAGEQGRDRFVRRAGQGLGREADAIAQGPDVFRQLRNARPRLQRRSAERRAHRGASGRNICSR